MPPTPAARQTQTRSAGILLHITSLPGRYGIGDLGPAAHAFIQALARARQTWWQILPITPAAADGNPYNSCSAFAGNPNLISPDILLRDGLLRRTDLAGQAFPEGRADYPRIHRFKSRILHRAWERFSASPAHSLHPDFERFRHDHAAWLDDFALFMAIRELDPGPWTHWDRPLAHRHKDALETARRQLADAIQRQQFIQFLFSRQLHALRRHANDLGVRLFGDLPIFVAADSADVWANPHLFLLDRDRRPRFVSGVPPDYFSETGQRWGNPLYNFPAMKQDHFAWWVASFRNTLAQVDMIRIDHFRGFQAFWQIPAKHPTARHGRWVKAPGRALFRTLRRQLGQLPLVAEDLGLITPDVVALRQAFNFPGMKVLQFAFGGSPDDPFLPHNYDRNTVAYTGTHDNDTTAGWFASLDPRQRLLVRRYLGGAPRDIAWAMIRLVWASVADTAIAPIQDLLGLGTEARLNLPGTAEGNWSWRLRPRMLDNRLWDRLAELTETYGRAPPAQAPHLP